MKRRVLVIDIHSFT